MGVKGLRTYQRSISLIHVPRKKAEIERFLDKINHETAINQSIIIKDHIEQIHELLNDLHRRSTVQSASSEDDMNKQIRDILEQMRSLRNEIQNRDTATYDSNCDGINKVLSTIQTMSRHVDEEENSKQDSKKAPLREEMPLASNYSECQRWNEHSSNTHYSQPCTQYPLSPNAHCYPATDRCHYSNNPFHSEKRQLHVPCPNSAFPNENCSSKRCPDMANEEFKVDKDQINLSKLILPDARCYEKIDDKFIHENKSSIRNESVDDIVTKFKVSQLEDTKNNKRISKDQVNLSKLILPDVNCYEKFNQKNKSSIKNKSADVIVGESEDTDDDAEAVFSKTSKTRRKEIPKRPKNRNFRNPEGISLPKSNHPDRRSRRRFEDNDGDKKIGGSSVAGSNDDSDSSVESQMSKVSHRSNRSTCSKSSKKKIIFWTTHENYARNFNFEKAKEKIKSMNSNTFPEAESKKKFNLNPKSNKNFPSKEGTVDKNTRSSETNNVNNNIENTSSEANNNNNNKTDAPVAIIRYPSKEEATKSKISLDEPLEQCCVFVGTTADGHIEYHTARCLRDIYKYEEKYERSYVISLS